MKLLELQEENPLAATAIALLVAFVDGVRDGGLPKIAAGMETSGRENFPEWDSWAAELRRGTAELKACIRASLHQRSGRHGN